MPFPSSLPFDFAQPAALLALLALIPAAWAVRHAAHRARRAEAAYGGPDELRLGVARWRGRARVALALAALLLLVIALARPRWGRAQVPIERRGIDVVIALDVSRSMSASDVAPTRARAALAGLQSMIEHLQGDRVGLVTFAGSAFMRAPLTTDLDAVSQLVARARPTRRWWRREPTCRAPSRRRSACCRSRIPRRHR